MINPEENGLKLIDSVFSSARHYEKSLYSYAERVEEKFIALYYELREKVNQFEELLTPYLYSLEMVLEKSRITPEGVKDSVYYKAEDLINMISDFLHGLIEKATGIVPAALKTIADMFTRRLDTLEELVYNVSAIDTSVSASKPQEVQDPKTVTCLRRLQQNIGTAGQGQSKQQNKPTQKVSN